MNQIAILGLGDNVRFSFKSTTNPNHTHKHSAAHETKLLFRQTVMATLSSIQQCFGYAKKDASRRWLKMMPRTRHTRAFCYRQEYGKAGSRAPEQPTDLQRVSSFVGLRRNWFVFLLHFLLLLCG